MGGARDVGWVAAGLVLGAGACYCIYRLTRGQPRRSGGRRLRPSRSADLTSDSCDDVLNAEQLQKLLYLLESTEDPVIMERALVTLGNNAAFSANQAVIRELGGIPIVGDKINNPNHSIKEKALNALNNLSVNVENQIKIKIYIKQICEDVFSGPLNSAVQLAGLRVLTNMTVTNDHQHMLKSYITDLFQVLLTGNGNTKQYCYIPRQFPTCMLLSTLCPVKQDDFQPMRTHENTLPSYPMVWLLQEKPLLSLSLAALPRTPGATLIECRARQVQVLKLLLNLSENPAMTEGLLRAQVDSSFLSLYDGHVAKEILLRVLTLFQNINNCLRMEGQLATQPLFSKGSLFFLLYGEECAQKMRALVYHHDVDVKEKALTIIPKF
ncbi:armadillo repeat-containing protein 10 isoform 2-T2 [Callospermophilus lateralis]|uniref:armadillo repeat-containing protein 10 isoform X2 n=1 Tax=Callospermophilus lateralis TaxID=76772 RepID=UPI004038BA96